MDAKTEHLMSIKALAKHIARTIAAPLDDVGRDNIERWAGDILWHLEKLQEDAA